MNDEQARLPGRDSRAGVQAEPSYERFLEALRQGEHPPFCELVWDGAAFYIVLQLHFQKTGETSRSAAANGPAVRREAWRYFSRIEPEQRRLLHIRVAIKHGLPVTAEVVIHPEAAGLFQSGAG